MRNKKYYLIKCTVSVAPKVFDNKLTFRVKIKIKRKNGESFSLNEAIEYFLKTQKIVFSFIKNGKIKQKKTRLSNFVKSEHFRSINFDIYKV